MSRNTERITLDSFISENHITMSVEQTDSNPHMEDNRQVIMDHWRCVIKHSRKRFTVVFSMGPGHHGKTPTTADVLDCVVSDASGYDNAGSFKDWASEYGYSEDSRKAERTYKAVQRSAERLKALLGDDLYETLLNHTERL